MLSLQPYSSIPNSTLLILSISAGLSVVTNFANRYLVNMEMVKSAMHEVNAWRKEFNKARKTNDRKLLEKAMKKQKAIMRLQSKVTMDRMKIMFIFMIPFYIIFIVLNGFFSSLPDPTVALTPLKVIFIWQPPFLVPGEKISFILWYIICSMAVSSPLAKLLGIYPEM